MDRSCVCDGRFKSGALCLAIEDFRFGVGTDADYFWFGPEANRLVKNSLKLAGRLIHHDDRGALGHPHDPAKPAFHADDVA